MTINDVEVRFEYGGDNIGQGNFGLVIHAFDYDNNKCFALKISEIDERTEHAVRREWEVLNYFNTLEEQQGFAARNHIIKMHRM
ncbi:unnamed protein product [Meloidogyne enterolobii]|uniref:Uncharacterized protein n=1 Tax=Meloidogyne enterolobii TaxID=390850 RepID=A0ACB1APY0_MELEN